MKASEIFQKTTKGQSEIETKTNALSMKERRVLILVNGQNNAGTLRDLSLCDNIIEILETLVSQGFIASAGAASGAATDFEPEPEPAAQASTEPAAAAQAPAEPAAAAAAPAAAPPEDNAARDFMVNTLLTFANRVRVAKLIEQINSSGDMDSLNGLVKPWYDAISETPGGMYQADDLKKEVLGMIQNQ